MIKKLYFLYIQLILLLAHNHWWENSKVQELTVQNFNDFVGKSSHVILEFYTPWCFYCQAMFQQYEDLRALYNGENPKRSDVLISKINLHDHQEIAQKYNINSFPTIVHFPANSQEFDSVFKQMRTKDVMSNWIEQICGPEKKIISESIEKKEEPDSVQTKTIEKKTKDFEEIGIEKEQKQVLDILLTVADQIKYLETTSQENNEKILGLLDNLKTSKEKEETSSLMNENPLFKNVGVNIKHVSIFFMLGMLLGLALAFTLIKLKRLNHILPNKTV